MAVPSVWVSVWLTFELLWHGASLELSGFGSDTFWPVVRSWSTAYTNVDSTLEISFNASNARSAISQMVDAGDESLDFGMIDFQKLNSSQYEEGYRVFPILQTAIVPQINLPQIGNIILSRSVLSQIYLGNITNWRDPAIIALNPKINLPNATIRVFYRSQSGSFNSIWTSGLSAWSDTWNNTYGVINSFPKPLRGLPNFSGATSNMVMNAAVAWINYSIGYAPYYLVDRDQNLHYAKLIHKNTGLPLEVNETTLQAASETAYLNEWFEAAYEVDGDKDLAWPLASYIYILIDSTPSDCNRARAMYKFFRWVFTDSIPRQETLQFGCGPLNANISKLVLDFLSEIQCDGMPIGFYEASERKGTLALAFLIIAILAFAAGLVLSGIHIYHFSKSQINAVYSLVFVIGTTLTLLSPIFWYSNPTDGVCLGRVWTASLGFSILLGTMFSRTWQLHDIYTLQKQHLENLRSQKSAHNTLIQLAITLLGVILTNLMILASWSIADPLRARFIVVDEYRLTGYWTCSCNQTQLWLLLELFFFLFLLMFGIYVIYRTWSFQRQALLTETRWVLVALYNIIMNLAAVVPLLSFLDVTENVLAVIVIISIDISGGSIVCAVLLPRVISKLELSTHGSRSPKTGALAQSPTIPGSTKLSQQAKEISRTPEEDFAKRLEDPQPMRLNTLVEKSEHEPPTDHLELQPLHSHFDSLDVSSSHYVEPPQKHRQGMAMLEEVPSDDNIQIISSQTESLKWNSNPIKTTRAESPDSAQDLDDSVRGKD